jgi:hypothetical protein
MKSAPELWELLDDKLQLRHWSARLRDGDGAVEVTAREPGRLLAWRCDGVKVKVKLEELGVGSKVSIAHYAPVHLSQDALLEVLDQLQEPQRRPFSAV